MNKVKFSFLFLLLAIVSNSCSKESNDIPENPLDEVVNTPNGKSSAVFNSALVYGTMTDQDGNVYKTIRIGTQTWMAENLRTTKYRNGTDIPEVSDNGNWCALSIGGYCNFSNTKDLVYIATYGRLYNELALANIAPIGWHVPSETEWLKLINYLGGEAVAGGKLKEAGTTHWLSPNTGATNSSGFTAVPSGYRKDDYGWFISDGKIAYFAGTQVTSIYDCRYLTCNDTKCSSSSQLRNGYAVRLVKD